MVYLFPFEVNLGGKIKSVSCGCFQLSELVGKGCVHDSLEDTDVTVSGCHVFSQVERSNGAEAGSVGALCGFCVNIWLPGKLRGNIIKFINQCHKMNI